MNLRSRDKKAGCGEKCCEVLARTRREVWEHPPGKAVFTHLMRKTARPIVEFTKKNTPFSDRIGYAKTHYA